MVFFDLLADFYLKFENVSTVALTRELQTTPLTHEWMSTVSRHQQVLQSLLRTKKRTTNKIKVVSK